MGWIAFRKLRWPAYVIALYAFIGVFNSLIANHHPLMASSNEGVTFPAFRDFASDLGLIRNNRMEQRTAFDWALYPPIRYAANYIDIPNAGFKSPGDCTPGSGHFFGTDQLGRDIGAGMVRGCYTSLRIGIFGTLLSGILGLFIGICMGYFEDKGLSMNVLQSIMLISSLFLGVFYLFFPLISDRFLNVLLVLVFLGVAFLTLCNLSIAGWKKFQFPLDSMVMRLIELRRSVPSLIFVLILFPLFSRPDINNVILIITLLGWTGFARHARAETLSVKQRDFVQGSRIMGAKFFYIAIRHILPNIGHTILILAAMNFASNILLESTLSFLGMGLPPEEVSWGSQLSDARKNYFAWWSVLFPGMTLFILVYTINRLADNFMEST
ncbi:MAG: ABC transporter permease [Saprospiraceae bacterium]|nr:ABC transporter permease [Saprospiraceae bacterium]